MHSADFESRVWNWSVNFGETLAGMRDRADFGSLSIHNEPALRLMAAVQSPFFVNELAHSGGLV